MKGVTNELRDPVCGAAVERGESRLSAEYKKKRYFFCSDSCRRSFEERTARFRVNDLARAGALLTTGRVRWGLA